MRIAIIGSRNCANIDINNIIANLPDNCSEIVSGGADGIDNLARKTAEKLNIPMVEFIPEYDLFGKSAPLVRNKKIIDYCDFVLSFWDFKSNGTKYVINECIKANIPVKVISV
jgi:Predicted Rossmann fold nucleotide-binding protein involved in DNA uptake